MGNTVININKELNVHSSPQKAFGLSTVTIACYFCHIIGKNNMYLFFVYGSMGI